MQLYKDFNSRLLSPSKQNIVPQEMLIKGEYYIWEYCTCVILLRFVSHHSKYDIQAKIIIYKGVMQSEDDIPQILTTSGGIFYKLINNPIKPFLAPLLNLRQTSS